MYSSGRRVESTGRERQPTRVIFDAKKEYEDAVTSWLKEFCGGTENSLAYRTKRDYLQEFGKMKQMYSIAGGALSFILALIGVLNFVNVITTSILSRKQEFAMMESIGMTVGQQKRICGRRAYSMRSLPY